MSGFLSSQETGIYLIPVSDYVTGKFSPEDHPFFVNLDSTNIPVARKGLFLRKEAAEAWKRLISDFKKENPNIKIYITSATRNFYAQKKIWEEKWTGKRKINGINSIDSIKDSSERAKIILKFSSMPGTSRHHWGTDIDINILDNEYYNQGDGKIIYLWLSKNAKKYGFCQPYSSGRNSGYEEEKWHWSYLPLAKEFLKDWNRIYNMPDGDLWGRDSFIGIEHARVFAPIYVNSINSECK